MCVQYQCRDCDIAIDGEEGFKRCYAYYLIPPEQRDYLDCPAGYITVLVDPRQGHRDRQPCPGPKKASPTLPTTEKSTSRRDRRAKKKKGSPTTDTNRFRPGDLFDEGVRQRVAAEAEQSPMAASIAADSYALRFNNSTANGSAGYSQEYQTHGHSMP